MVVLPVYEYVFCFLTTIKGTVVHLPPVFSLFLIAPVTVVEVFGHAGVRMYFTAPQAFPTLLQKMDCDITLEDHELHHRNGHRGLAGNYGKQTRIWDRVFGTVQSRVEGPNENIDKNLPVNLPF